MEGCGCTQLAGKVHGGRPRGQGSDSLAVPPSLSRFLGLCPLSSPHTIWLPEGVSPPRASQPCPDSDKLRGHPSKAEVKLWPGSFPAVNLPT